MQYPEPTTDTETPTVQRIQTPSGKLLLDEEGTAGWIQADASDAMEVED